MFLCRFVWWESRGPMNAQTSTRQRSTGPCTYRVARLVLGPWVKGQMQEVKWKMAMTIQRPADPMTMTGAPGSSPERGLRRFGTVPPFPGIS